MKDRSSLKYVAIVEARMTSSRLPGKMMKAIGGKPSIQILLERLSRTPRLDQCVVATTAGELDKPMIEFVEKSGWSCFRGSEDDVLGRVLGAARHFAADVIVEITGDCTFIDPDIVQESIDAYIDSDADFVANCVSRPHYPPGMDARIFSVEQLALVDQMAQELEYREHVSSYFWETPGKFKLLHVRPPASLALPDTFVALDTQEDLELMRKIHDALAHQKPDFTAHDIVSFLQSARAEAAGAHVVH